jgi:uncharacterized membrane protein YphA (DoxX/SURF4 family)
MAQGESCKGGSCCKQGSAVFGALCVPLRVALGGLFLYAAYNKLFIMNGPQLFSESIKAFKVFDPKSQEQLIQMATFVTPWIEIVAGLALVLGFWTRAAAGVLGLLLLGFIGLIASALARGLNVSCGCFGKISPFCPEKIGMCNIVQNSILLAMALLIMMCSRHVLALTGGRPSARPAK